MMRTKTKKQEKRHFFIKSYQHIWQLEEVIQQIRENATAQLQLSVLGRFSHECLSSDKEILKAKKELKRYWKGSLGPASDFGVFCNPEIGTLFIAGTLASQFLNSMDGKTLGELPSGPYGILRGLGIAESNAASYIKNLNKGYFLIILRGYAYELDSMGELLESIE